MRLFDDETGAQWQVYEVSRDALALGRPDFLPAEFRNGWLVFDGGVERRRLAPYPPEWVEFSVDALRMLLAGSEIVDRRRGPRIHRDNPDTAGLELT
ncbi:MAG TPA: hypothetical protein VN706_11410 [Gemmatimonadaceae bacterium]|nr:hypothetical protein [Gemmatimonadaceae bacterium]